MVEAADAGLYEFEIPVTSLVLLPGCFTPFNENGIGIRAGQNRSSRWIMLRKKIACLNFFFKVMNETRYACLLFYRESILFLASLLLRGTTQSV